MDKRWTQSERSLRRFSQTNSDTTPMYMRIGAQSHTVSLRTRDHNRSADDCRNQGSFTEQNIKDYQQRIQFLNETLKEVHISEAMEPLRSFNELLKTCMLHL